MHKAICPDTYRGEFKSLDLFAGPKYAQHVRELCKQIEQSNNDARSTKMVKSSTRHDSNNDDDDDHKDKNATFDQPMSPSQLQKARERPGKHRLAAFYAESVLGCAGQIVLAPGYLKHAFRHVRRAGMFTCARMEWNLH